MASRTVQLFPADPAPAGAGFGELTVPVTGGVLGYREAGSHACTIVLLHGISSGAGSWSECARLMAPHARVIAWDAPGYGQSSPLDSAAPSALDYAQRLHALLETLQVDKCLLVGHSLGALMAAAYSSLPDSRAGAYVLMSPALGYQGARSAQASRVREGRLTALKELGIEGIARNLPDRLLTAQASEHARDTVRNNALRLQPAGYTQAVELLCGDDIDRFKPPQDRTLVYCGDSDIVTTPEQSAQYAQRHGYPFALIPHAGHACYVEQPHEVARILLEAAAKFDVQGTKT